MSTCKFCALLTTPNLGAALPNLVLETDRVVAALNRRPVAPGHVTLILKAHHEQTSDLVDTHLTGFGDVAGRVARVLEKAYGPARVVLLGDGKRSAHLHFHLIPEPAGATLDAGAAVTDLNLATRPPTLSDAETTAAVRALREALQA